nr:MAG TPA: N-acetylmuramoyl-L-alanine amidase [Caudoviricetes sp.]
MEFKDIVQALNDARPSFYKYPWPVRVYLHWTAGHYHQPSSAYHICIDADGSAEITRPIDQVPAATYGRNAGSIAISLEGCADAAAYKGTPYRVDLGSEPPTDAQIETMAQLMAAISTIYNIPIDIQHFMTHAEAADNMDGQDLTEPYGPATTCERWDLAVLKNDDQWMDGGNILRGKAIFYQQQAEENGGW